MDNENESKDLFKKAFQIIDALKSMDDEGIEVFIKVGKEQGHITNEDELRKVIKEIKSGE